MNNDQIEGLATNEYIKKRENRIIVGATASGKSYIACALGVAACNTTLKVIYVRLPDCTLFTVRIFRWSGSSEWLVNPVGILLKWLVGQEHRNTWST